MKKRIKVASILLWVLGLGSSSCGASSPIASSHAPSAPTSLPSQSSEDGIEVSSPEASSSSDFSSAHVHVPGVAKEEKRTEPTCTQNGGYDLVTYCQLDGEEISREHQVIPALGHDWVRSETEPTYEAPGQVVYACSRCGEILRTEEGKPQLEHHYSESFEHDEAKHWKPCTDEGYEFLKKDEGFHNYETHHYDATYENMGYLVYVCLDCGYTFSVTDEPVKQHHYDSVWSFDSRVHYHECTDPGYPNLRGDEEAHSFVDQVVESTFHERGYTVHTCSICGYSYEDTYTPIKEHHYASDWSSDSSGHWHACLDPEGDDFFSNVKDYDFHSFDSVITAPTFDAEGYTTYTCSVCGYYYRDAYTNVRSHSYSQEWYSDSLTHFRVCTDEGYEWMRTDESSHSFVDSVVPRTFEHGGCITHTCSVCGYVYTSEETPPFPHSYASSWSSDESKHWLACIDEGYEDSRSSEGEHDFIDQVVQPTFELDGYTLHTCATCGYSYRDSVVSKLEHSYSDEWTAGPNTHYHVCLDHGYENLKSEEQAHVFSPLVGQEATLGEDGHFTQTCEVCGYTESITVDALAKQQLNFTLHDQEGEPFYSVSARNQNLSGAIVIPESLNGIAVKQIDISGFRGCASITSLEILGEIDAICDYAFAGCSDLRSISLHAVKSIGECAFMDCAKLEEIDWGSELESIGESGFSGCQALRFLTLPSTLAAMGDLAFADCSFLLRADLGTSIRNLGSTPFSGCVRLVEIIDGGIMESKQVLPGTQCFVVPTIAESGWQENEGLVTYDDGDKLWFAAYYGTNPQVEVPAGVTDVRSYAISSIDSVFDVHLPDGLEEIHASAFSGAHHLVSVTIPSSVSSIENSVFDNCPRLMEIINLSSLVESNRYGAPSDAEVFELGPSRIAINEAGFVSWEQESKKTLLDYRGQNTDITIPGYFSAIRHHAFYHNFTLTNVTLPSTLSSIGASAFESNKSLIAITIPATVTNVGASAFKNCVSLQAVNWNATSANVSLPSTPIFEACDYLTQITIGSTVKNVPAYAFYRCQGITEITIPENVEGIGSEAFAECSSLTTVHFNARNCGEVNHSYPCFARCSSLRTIEFGPAVQQIPAYLCCGLASLENVRFSSSITAIGKGAFFSSGLASITIPGTIKTIGEKAFADCARLVSVTLCEGIETIGKGAFRSCQNLASIEFCDSISSIGDYAFAEDRSLVTVDLPSGLEALGAYAFANCENVKTLSFGKTLSSVGESAFQGVFRNWWSENYVVYYDGSIGDWCGISFANGDANPAKVGFVIPDENGDLLYRGKTYSSPFQSWCLTIPYGVTTIGDYQFGGIRSIYAVEIPSTVTSIGEGAFAGVGVPGNPTGGWDANGKPFIYGGVYYDGTIEDWCNISIGDAAFEGTDRKFYFLDENGDEVHAEKNYSLLRELVVPEGVTVIGDYQFYRFSQLTSITLPSTLISIGDYAFTCASISEITIPSSLSTIGAYPFAQCSSLKKIYWNASGVSFDDKPAFFDTTLETIIVGDGVQWIDFNLFEYPHSYSLVLPSSITRLGNVSNATVYYAGSLEQWLKISRTSSFANVYFIDPQGTIEFDGKHYSPIIDVTIPEDITIIRQFQFNSFADLRTVILGEAIVQIGDSAFGGCLNLSRIEWRCRDCAASSSAFAFSNNCEIVFGGEVENVPTIFCFTGIVSISFEEGVEMIPESAFYGCASLSTLQLPESLRTIGDHAFTHCDMLSSVTIPSSVASIGQYAFSNCAGLKYVQWNATRANGSNTVFYGCENIISFSFGDNVQMITTYPSNLDSVTLPSSLQEIGDSCFESSSIREISLPESLLRIGEFAFANSQLVYVSIPENVTSIGVNAFYNCGSLVRVAYGAADANVDYPFSACNALDSLQILSTVQTIPSFCFEALPIRSVSFEEGATSIGQRAFAYCTNLELIVLPNSIENIGIAAFRDCTSLQSTTLPSGLTEISEGLFAGCTTLVSVSLPSTLTAIGSCAFYDAPLSELVLPASVKTIGQDAFNNVVNAYINARALESGTVVAENLVIGLNVKSLPEEFFWENSNLTSLQWNAAHCELENYGPKEPLRELQFGDRVRYIPAVFQSCANIKELTIPASVTEIEQGAFSDCTGLEIVYWNAEQCADLEAASIYIFHNCVNLEELVIGASVRHFPGFSFCSSHLQIIRSESDDLRIGGNAFSGCESLEKVFLLGSTSLGEFSFANCPNLSQFPFFRLTEVGDGAFSDCTSLTEVEFSSDLVKMGLGAFYRCSGITSMTLPFIGETKNENGYFAWLFTNPSQDFYPPADEYWHEFEDRLNDEIFFEAPTAISEITILDGLTRLQDYAFFGSSFVASVTLPQSITSIGKRSFYGCSSLASIDLPSGLTSIGEFAFGGCSSLQSIILPDKIVSLPSGAFSGCTSLVSIALGSSIIDVSKDAFDGCMNLRDISVSDGNKYLSYDEGLFYFSIASSTTLILCMPWLEIATIKDGTTKIAEGVFSHNDCIVSIFVPNSVVEIEGDNFVSCAVLSALSLGSGLQSIQGPGVYDCPNLSEIYFAGNMNEFATRLGVSVVNGSNVTVVHCLDGDLNY